jgi:hypothetical protein
MVHFSSSGSRRLPCHLTTLTMTNPIPKVIAEITMLMNADALNRA